MECHSMPENCRLHFACVHRRISWHQNLFGSTDRHVVENYFSKANLSRVFLGHRHPAMRMRHLVPKRWRFPKQKGVLMGWVQSRGWVHCSAVSKAKPYGVTGRFTHHRWLLIACRWPSCGWLSNISFIHFQWRIRFSHLTTGSMPDAPKKSTAPSFVGSGCSSSQCPWCGAMATISLLSFQCWDSPRDLAKKLQKRGAVFSIHHILYRYGSIWNKEDVWRLTAHWSHLP